MATTYTSAVQQLYVAYFNRPADPAGLDFWTKAVTAANGDTSAVAAAFATTPEYTATFSGMTNAQMVAAVYQNLFGRAADATGAAFWTAALDAKTITMANVVTSIAAGAQGTDAVIVSDKVAAASAFTAAVDTQAEIAGYSGVAANAAAKAWLSTVTDANSLTVALDPATLASTVAKVVAAGTPFTVAGALASLDAANNAVTKFIATIDTDKDGSTTDTTADDITGAKATAVTTVAADLKNADGTANTAAATLFAADSSTTAVREALISAQQATNAKTLSDDQAKVAADNVAIAKIAGLTAAVTTLASANTALTASNTAATAAHADLLAKETSFPLINEGTLAVTATAITLTDSEGAHTLATINAAHKATLATGVTATDYTGLTELIASYNADVTAAASASKALDNVHSAQLSVNLLDVSTTGTVGSTGLTESALIAQLAAQINETTPNSVTTGTAPTASQIQTELSILNAATDHTDYDAFKALVDAETASGADTATAAFNPLVAQLNAHNALVKTDSDAVAKLAKDVATLHTATSNVDTLTGLQASVTADTKVLTDKGYVVTTLDTAHTGTTLFGTASSDVYVVDSANATINLFGLQGADSLFVGTGYTMVQGAIGAKGVVGNDAALEVFVSTSDAGDAVLQVETHAFSSGTTGAATSAEIVTITLTGVDASTLHLGTDGIITSGTAATTA